MKTVMVYIINNEWYLTYDKETLIILGEALFVDSSTSAILGENVGVITSETIEELYAKVKELNLIGEVVIHKEE